MAQSRRSVTVIGGGVIGLSVALALQERGLDVTIADPGGNRQPSWGNAGRIATELNEPLASFATLRSLPRSLFAAGGAVAFPPREAATWLPFGLRLIGRSAPRQFASGTRALGWLLSRALPAWRNRLAVIDAADLLIENGHYSIWESKAAHNAGRAAWMRNAGAATAADLDMRDRDRLQSLLAVPIAGALRFSGTASIADPTDLLDTMAAAFLQQGGRFERRKAIVDEAADIADIVVVAAGIGSAELLRSIGHRVPMIAERGYHIEQPETCWPRDLPSIFFEERSIVLARFRSTLRATSFVEFARDDSPPDPRKWDRLFAHAKALDLPFDDRATRWHGSRPTLPDYLPAIGRSGKRHNLFYAFGHQHLGLTLAAVTGEVMAKLIDGKPDPELAAFDLARFG